MKRSKVVRRTKVWDITQPIGWMQEFSAELGYLAQGLTIRKKVITVDYQPTEYDIEVEVEHFCDMRDYPEICEECYENHREGLNQYAEDVYRYG